MLRDVVQAKIYGAAGTEENLLAQMGPDQELNRAVLHFTEACLVFSYSSRGVELDFSEKSLEQVDTIIEQFHQNREKMLASAAGLPREDIVNWYGCYAGEVFRRVLGGEWVTDASSPVAGGQKITHLNVSGNRIYVVTKVHKYLEHGSEDSLAFLLRSVRSIIQGQIATRRP